MLMRQMFLVNCGIVAGNVAFYDMEVVLKAFSMASGVIMVRPHHADVSEGTDRAITAESGRKTPL